MKHAGERLGERGDLGRQVARTGVQGALDEARREAKVVGEGAVESIVEARSKGGPFSSLEDFCNRVDMRQANKKVVESLIKSGAMDRLSPEEPLKSRPKFLSQMENLMAHAVKLRDPIRLPR